VRISLGGFTWRQAVEDRASLLQRIVRYELPIEDTIAMLRAYGWDARAELVRLSATDALRILERYLSGELSAKQIEHWAELLELRDDVGFEDRSSGELRRLIFVLANPEVNEPLTPALAIRLRRVLAGDAA
jgi:hypothetical protein